MLRAGDRALLPSLPRGRARVGSHQPLPVTTEPPRLRSHARATAAEPAKTLALLAAAECGRAVPDGPRGRLRPLCRKSFRAPALSVEDLQLGPRDLQQHDVQPAARALVQSLARARTRGLAHPVSRNVRRLPIRSHLRATAT